MRDGRIRPVGGMVTSVFANPVNGRQSPRSRLTAIALVVVGAVVLSTATVLGLHWASASSRKMPVMRQAQGLGFTKLDRQAPAVLLPNLRGSGTLSIAMLAGKPIVLNFWASTCEVCKSETPALASVARTLGGKVTFVGIDSVDRHGPAMAFITKYNVHYPIGFDPQGIAAIKYGVVALPVTFFLSPSGKTIMGENIGALTRGTLRAILHNLYGTT
jgi:thiol-disulfide isomerase/thioredoxin